MNYDSAAKRYMDDPKFHQCVQMFYSLINELQMTPSEMQDALMFALIKFENEHVRSIPCGHLTLLKQEKQ